MCYLDHYNVCSRGQGMGEICLKMVSGALSGPTKPDYWGPRIFLFTNGGKGKSQEVKDPLLMG